MAAERNGKQIDAACGAFPGRCARGAQPGARASGPLFAELLFAGLLLGAALWAVVGLPGQAQAQLSDEGTFSTGGTQFVKPTPPKKPKEPEQPKAEEPPPPDLPQIQQPERVVPPAGSQPPPRYPSVVFLLDTSDSMLNKVRGRDLTRLEEAKLALKQVIEEMSRETRVQMWIFNSRMKPVTIGGAGPREFIAIGQEGTRAKLAGRISGIRTGGGTNLYRAIIQALEIFAAPGDQEAYRSGQRFPVLVVISDGEDAQKTGHNLASVMAARQRFPLVTINTIGFHAGGGKGWQKKLCQIATHPSGCATADNRERLRAILESFYRPRR